MKALRIITIVIGLITIMGYAFLLDTKNFFRLVKPGIYPWQYSLIKSTYCDLGIAKLTLDKQLSDDTVLLLKVNKYNVCLQSVNHIYPANFQVIVASADGKTLNQNDFSYITSYFKDIYGEQSGINLKDTTPKGYQYMEWRKKDFTVLLEFNRSAFGRYYSPKDCFAMFVKPTALTDSVIQRSSGMMTRSTAC